MVIRIGGNVRLFLLFLNFNYLKSSSIFDSLIGGALLSFNVKDNNYNYYEYPLVGMHWL